MHKWRVTVIPQTGAYILRMPVMPLMGVVRLLADNFDIADGDAVYERTQVNHHVIVSHGSKHAMMMYQIRESEFCNQLLIEEIEDA